MLATMVDQGQKIKKKQQKKHRLKCSKVIPPKTETLTKIKMIQNLIFLGLFLKIFFRAYNFSPHVPVDIIRAFFNPEFVAENFKANKTSQKDHPFYNTVSRKKPHSYYESELF